MKIPDGTFMNCRYPAACGNAPSVGSLLTSAASQCISKMLFAAGLDDDVNASFYGSGAVGSGSNTGGPGFFYGGHNQHGLPVGQGLYDMHGSGFGAAPYRDGVSTGGHINNPSVGISDIENIELQYPLVYFSRNHMLDSGGFGMFRGGQGLQRIIMVYGTGDLTVNYSPYHGIPGGWGLFGGYPMGIGGSKFVVEPKELDERLQRSRFPVAYAEMTEWGSVVAPKLPPLQRLKIPEKYLIADPVEVGSGYGDPLDRDPQHVLADVVNSSVSRDIAAKVFGVIVADDKPSVDVKATEERRSALKRARLEQAAPIGGRSAGARFDGSGARLRRVHEYVEVARLDDGSVVYRCSKCSHVYGPHGGNYKHGSVRRVVSSNVFSGANLPSGAPILGELHEYFCPGCGTQVDVEVHVPTMETGPEPVWDIRIEAIEPFALPGNLKKKRAASPA
jgi:hypothetical protein